MAREKRGKRPETLLLSEVQVLLAEKRTYYSILRTGLAIITVPLSIIIFLIAAKDFHNLFQSFWLSLIIVGCLLAISIAGVYLVVKSSRKVKKIDRMILGIEKEDDRVDNLVID